MPLPFSNVSTHQLTFDLSIKIFTFRVGFLNSNFKDEVINI